MSVSDDVTETAVLFFPFNYAARVDRRWTSDPSSQIWLVVVEIVGIRVYFRRTLQSICSWYVRRIVQGLYLHVWLTNCVACVSGAHSSRAVS